MSQGTIGLALLIHEQAGTLDDISIIDNFKSEAELFTKNRPKWISAQEGAAQN